MGARFSAWLSSISPKLYAAAAGAGAGAAVQEFVLWLLGVQVWGALFDAGNAQAAIDAVPGPVAKGVAVAVILLGTVIGAYAAPSTPAPPEEHDHGTAVLPLDDERGERVDPNVDNTEPLGRHAV